MTARFSKCVVLAAALAAGFAGEGRLYAQGKKPAVTSAGPKPHFGPELQAIFFDDARSKLGPGSLPGDDGGPAPVPAGGGRVPGAPTASTPAAAPAGGGGEGSGEWSKLISRDVLEDEIKSQIAAMALSVKAKGKFKSAGYKDAAVQLSTVATMFGIIALFDGPDVRWKDLSAALRDKIAKAGLACKEGSDESHKLASDAAALLSELIGGGKVELPPASASTVPWPNVADLGPLMKRMEAIQMGVLQPSTANEGEFNANKAKIQREAMLLRALGQVIQDSAYNEEEEYTNFAKSMQAGADALYNASSKDGASFSNAQAAVGVITKACADCHSKFK